MVRGAEPRGQGPRGHTGSLTELGRGATTDAFVPSRSSRKGPTLRPTLGSWNGPSQVPRAGCPQTPETDSLTFGRPEVQDQGVGRALCPFCPLWLVLPELCKHVCGQTRGVGPPEGRPQCPALPCPAPPGPACPSCFPVLTTVLNPGSWKRATRTGSARLCPAVSAGGGQAEFPQNPGAVRVRPRPGRGR